ncbi:MAG TPA: hypothetical protein VFP20_01695 [Bacteroidales bacterium]|nr:hypothetical protein [Bacteroidales bacterium]
MFKKTLVLLGMILTLTALQAQQRVSVRTTIDSSSLMIGEQTLYHVEVSGPVSMRYVLPTFPGDTLVNGLEILNRGKLDTISINNERIELKTDYLVTSFDTGLYYIPPVKILAGNDTVESNNLAIKILTYEVDTTKLEFFDIKGVQQPPLVLSDYLFETILFLLLYGLILLIIWFYLRKKYPRLKESSISSELLLPPHVVAIMELDRLKAEKIWKSGKNKKYYTELTDILRKYIERRFQFNALEMTTEEILTLFKRDKSTQSVYQNLSQILRLADLVKFAKIEPLESENELSIMNSYLFVNQTKLEEVKTLDEQKEELIKDAPENEHESQVDDSSDLHKYMPK